MKEENANAVTPEVTEEKTTQPAVTEEKPAEVKTEAPAPVEEKKEEPVQAEAAPAPVEEKKEEAPAPTPIPQPAAEPAPKPQVVPQPAETPAPQPQPVAQAAPASIVPEVAPQQAAPAKPEGETIKEAPALNPIANNPQPVQPAVQAAPVPQATTQTTFAPSGPLQTDMDTNIGFVAVGENLKKKKNGGLIFTIVLILLVGLGALGYFVIYPYVVKKMTKPEQVYSTVIDNSFKSINSTVNLLAHSRATYTAELEIESNLENLKDLTGYTYVGNFGIDPENKNIQLGIKIKDKDSQEHSAFAYVKGERQYLRLSSYRELIFWPAYNEYKDTWEDLYAVFDDINQEDATYLVDKFKELLKQSIDKSKLTKEDASTPGLTQLYEAYEVLHQKMITCKKPIFPILPSLHTAGPEVAEFLKKGHVNFSDEVTLATALSQMIRTPKPAHTEVQLYGIDIPRLHKIIFGIQENGYVSPQTVRDILSCAGIPLVPELVSTSKEELTAFAEKCGYPVVAKVVGPVHKSDVGGVALNIRSKEVLSAEFDRMMQIPDATAIMVQKMIKGTELFIGAKYEERFGHVTLCGLGGIFVEVLNDVSSGLAPLTYEEAESMIHSLRGYKILQGTRGQKGINERKYAEIIVRLSTLLRFATEIKEIDINPLLADQDNVVAVDARILIEKE